jgi:hypothetical protein
MIRLLQENKKKLMPVFLMFLELIPQPKKKNYAIFFEVFIEKLSVYARM